MRLSMSCSANHRAAVARRGARAAASCSGVVVARGAAASSLSPLRRNLRRTQQQPTNTYQQQQQQPIHHHYNNRRRAGVATIAAAAAGQASSSAAPSAAAEPNVDEIMNPHPVLLHADAPIKDAVHAMLQADVSGAPVVDADGALVGVLTESDIVWKGAGAPEDHFVVPPVFIGFAEATIWLRDNAKFHDESRKILARTVAEAMTAAKNKRGAKGGKGGGAGSGLVWVAPEASMSDAARLMVHHDVNLLPVCEGGEGGKVIGVVTRHDVMRALYASGSPFLK